MGFCVSKQEYHIEKYEDSDLIKYEGLYINNKKNGYGIEFSKDQKKYMKDNM